MDTLREKRQQLQPSLDAIDRVDESVRKLEAVAQILDKYTQQLESELARAKASTRSI